MGTLDEIIQDEFQHVDEEDFIEFQVYGKGKNRILYDPTTDSIIHRYKEKRKIKIKKYESPQRSIWSR